MTRLDHNCVQVEAPCILANARRLLTAGEQHIAAGVCCFNFSAVHEVDSSALAVIFAWQRSAKAVGMELKLTHLPANLVSLGEVYGVAELLRQTT